MYFTIKTSSGKTICEIGIYSKRDSYIDDFWNNKICVSFNIEAYSDYLISHIDRAEKIKNIFVDIQKYILDYNENITGGYPCLESYTLDDPQLNETKSGIIKVTRERLNSIVWELKDTGIYINED